MHSANQLSQLYYDACIGEISALKPGNVHIFADGHGMRVEDFTRSAEITAPIIAAPQLSLGERIFKSVEATKKSVNCNTNLGIILLCAPLIQAALLGDNIQQQLSKILAEATQQDADYCFKAIALANPGGLGQSAQHDVQKPADCTLQEAMQFAKNHDLIAAQYCNDFADIFTVGLNAYEAALSNLIHPVWSTTVLFLTLMAHYEDSHVLRKHGAAAAATVKGEAVLHLAEFDKQFSSTGNPKLYQKILLQWDASLKERGINPGTCADLTVAVLLVHSIKRHAIIK